MTDQFMENLARSLRIYADREIEAIDEKEKPRGGFVLLKGETVQFRLYTGDTVYDDEHLLVLEETDIISLLVLGDGLINLH